MTAQEIPTLKSQYAEKVGADLDLNTAEQERIRVEIASLGERLAGLEQDHELLTGMRAALGTSAAVVPAPRAGRKAATSATTARKATKAAKATAAAGAAEASAKPTTAKAAKATKAVAKQAAPAKKAPAKQAAPAKKAPAKQAAPKKAVAPTEKQTPLAELIHQHLSTRTEPKTAGEVAQALTAVHPDRNLSDNVVRTTTERLVARGRVERAKQGSTVYYTAVQQGAAAVPAQAAAADEQVGNKESEVPVTV
ncbi:BlaI/MecI/CopY family transcriptional regulator [Streptomyces sp. G-G2]|uniref:BlaI/MecI/CopY family transcriptional regulator n=1 Tax=Streptomyces sp. G-G2 TaxID=3046201 RepID=UPI0024BB6378|nr:BlaI/MecI/CopY family transcriptional regulator [Streptomyces sp. G-G2]MDJ0380362.1 BlaI/MecI/CopY family transcriptional regulator [Streptomyces sp. G-G2]